jgi:hypothetical protein
MDKRRFWRLWRALPWATRLRVHRIAVRGEPAPGPMSAWLVCEYSTHMLAPPTRKLGTRTLALLAVILIEGASVALSTLALVTAYRLFYGRHYVPLMHRAIAVNKGIAEPPSGTSGGSTP